MSSIDSSDPRRDCDMCEAFREAQAAQPQAAPAHHEPVATPLEEFEQSFDRDIGQLRYDVRALAQILAAHMAGSGCEEQGCDECAAKVRVIALADEGCDD